MESSCDEEFGWTNTSNDESDTEPEMIYDGESESGKIYKKKLQKELFQNGKPESEETRESQQTPRKKSKKPKREESSRSPTPSPSPRRVKRESLVNGHDDSAAAERILKLKIKQERASLAGPQPSPRTRRASAAGLEPELEARPEQPLKKKKKRDKKRDAAKNETNESCATDAVDDLVNSSAEGHVDHASELPARKPKRKSEGKAEQEEEAPKDESYYESWWKFEAEETVVQPRPQPKPKPPKPLSKKRLAELANPLPSKEFVSDDSSSEDERRAPERARAGPGVARVADSPRRVSLAERITFEDESQSESGLKNVRKESHASTETTRRARISERITFEEDSQSASERPVPTLPQRKAPPEPARPGISERIPFDESGSEPAPRAAGGRLGRFLRAHAHMHPVLGEFPPGAAVTARDDVWLLHCPRDLPLPALRGLTLDLDFRSKLKVGGTAYEATPLAAAGERAAVLAPAARGRGFCVRSVVVRGALRLRARLPRPRPPPGAGDAEPERVPLPEARRRHPLLGADYERALQAALPPAVRRRLAAASVPLPRPTDQLDHDGERRQKKKKKKKHKERAEPEPEPIVDREPERKKRKRKHSSRHEPSPPRGAEPSPPRGAEREPEAPPRSKKAKKEKRQRDDASVWDSEQAIEESLFNF